MHNLVANFVPSVAALLPTVETLALAVVSTDPAQALRLIFIAAEMRLGGRR